MFIGFPKAKTHLWGEVLVFGVTDGKTNIVFQVAYWQVGHTGSQNLTDSGLIIQKNVLENQKAEDKEAFGQ